MGFITDLEINKDDKEKCECGGDKTPYVHNDALEFWCDNCKTSTADNELYL